MPAMVQPIMHLDHSLPGIVFGSTGMNSLWKVAGPRNARKRFALMHHGRMVRCPGSASPLRRHQTAKVL